jgi:hypothetical protein
MIALQHNPDDPERSRSGVRSDDPGHSATLVLSDVCCIANPKDRPRSQQSIDGSARNERLAARRRRGSTRRLDAWQMSSDIAHRDRTWIGNPHENNT